MHVLMLLRGYVRGPGTPTQVPGRLYWPLSLLPEQLEQALLLPFHLSEQAEQALLLPLHLSEQPVKTSQGGRTSPEQPVKTSQGGREEI